MTDLEPILSVARSQGAAQAEAFHLENEEAQVRFEPMYNKCSKEL